MSALGGAMRKLGLGRLGENTILFGFGLGTRALIQAAYLILLSRWMGSGGYGYFSGSVAAAMILSPLAGFGVHFLVSNRVGSDGTAATSLWATSLVQIALSGILLTALLIGLCVGILDQRLPLVAMLGLALSELVALPIANAAAGLSLATERGMKAMVLVSLVPICRLAMVAVLVLSGAGMEPELVVGMHLLGSVLGALACYVLMARTGIRPDWGARVPSAAATWEGMSHAVGALVGASYLELDKVVMLQFLEPAAVGAYTVSFRAAMVFVLPISALVAASIPRLCAAAGSGGESRLRRAVALAIGGYALLAAVGASLASFALPFVFGPEYEGSGGYMRMLAPWIVLYAAHQYVGTLLTTSGHQGSRVGIESLGFLLLLVLNVAWVPGSDASGAIAALYAAESVMIALASWIVAKRFWQANGALPR